MRKSLLLVLGLVCLGTVTAAAAAGPLDFEHVPGELLVKFRAGVDEADIDELNRVLGASGSRLTPLDPQLRHVRLPDTVRLESALAYYESLPEVLYAEPNYLRRLVGIPNDTRFGELWGMHNTGQSGGLADFDIDGPEGWDVQTDSPDVVIGSIDTGIATNHEDLVGNIWVNADEVAGNGVDDDANGYVDDVNGYDFVNNDPLPADDHNHGTHTMGTAAAKGNNAKGVAGVTWSAQIMALKVCNSFGSCPDSAIIPAIDYATANGARLTSNSYGGGGYNQAAYDAIARANAAGVLFSAAAGNNSRNTDLSPFYPANYDLPNIISVMSVDRTGGRSSFSNYGVTSVDLAAPGGSILSTIPGGYGTMSGTSMACPHVSGALAAIIGANPNLAATDYKQILMDTAVPQASLSGLCVTGALLNLRAALDAVPPLVVPPENQPPVADPGGPYRGKTGRMLTLDGSGSFDPNAPGGTGVNLNDKVALYVWNFGDGSSATTSSPTVQHAYDAPGTWTVTLTVKDKFQVASAPQTTSAVTRGR